MVITINDENKNTLYVPTVLEEECGGCVSCNPLKMRIRRMEEELKQLRAFAVLKNSQ